MAKSIKLLSLCVAMLMLVAVQVQANPGMANSGMGNPAVQGKIVETMNSGGYTYLNLDINGKKSWAAVPQTQVKVGDVVALNGGMVMQNFNSKTLGRTFPEIIFASGVAKR